MGNNDGNNDARQDYADMERENRRLRQVVISLEEEVAQLTAERDEARQVARDLFSGQTCGECRPERHWSCGWCKHRKVIEGWEVGDA